MTGLRTVIAKLKNWLHKKQPEHVCVRTYAGVFKFPEGKSLGSFGFDELVQYAEDNPNLHRVGLDKLPISGGQPGTPKQAEEMTLSRVFHQQINTLSLGWARYVVALRNQIK